jgi:hypothetical protein
VIANWGNGRWGRFRGADFRRVAEPFLGLFEWGDEVENGCIVSISMTLSEVAAKSNLIFGRAVLAKMRA